MSKISKSNNFFSVEMYNGFEKECCNLGLEYDIHNRRCEERANVVEHYLKDEEYVNCSKIFLDCCLYVNRPGLEGLDFSCKKYCKTLKHYCKKFFYDIFFLWFSYIFDFWKINQYRLLILNLNELEKVKSRQKIKLKFILMYLNVFYQLILWIYHFQNTFINLFLFIIGKYFHHIHTTIISKIFFFLNTEAFLQKNK